MRRICVFTGTRADYGIMSRLMARIRDDGHLRLQVIATGMHLSPAFGLTVREIEQDGFTIDRRVPILQDSDSLNGTAKSMGRALEGFAEALGDLRPDLALILGDRFEMLSAAQACLVYRIPVAHIAGGAISRGAMDDAMRHAITKLSHLHLTETQAYRRRVIQLGEHPSRVFWTGALGVSNILSEKVMGLEELEDSLDFPLSGRYLLVTFHPSTLEPGTAGVQCEALLRALGGLPEDIRILFTLPNSDPEACEIRRRILDFVQDRPDRTLAVDSLGRRRYYAAMSHATAVVGNSSSGLVEAPSFHVPTLNIGSRQEGRIRGASVADVPATVEGIREGLEKVLGQAFRQTASQAANPYYRPGTLEMMLDVLGNFPLEGILKKTFYDL